MVLIHTDFPGGNVSIEKNDGFEIVLTPELRDTEGFWFYWYFEAEFTCPGDYRFRTVNGTRGPAVSYDRGESWEWPDKNTARTTNRSIRRDRAPKK